jgi:pimeloyl-ACP methyl ester carboxylesterase
VQTWRVFEPRRIALRTADIAVLDAPAAGEPRGTALLVPGFTGSKEDFALILGDLAAAGYRALALDLPGQYQSPGPDERSAYTMSWLGSVVNEVADDTDGAPVHLVGHSFGGLVARAAVLARPDRYRSLTLMCSGPAAIDGNRRARMARLEPYAHQGMAVLFEAMVAEAPPPEPLAEFVRERFLASSAAGLFGMSDALLTEPDLVSKLRETGVPAMVCFGEHDDAWGPAAQREMARRLAARVEVFAGAAHSPAAESPAQTALTLLDFWSAI